MSLEGNLRDLELQEVLQLLAHSRKSGQLEIVAQLAGLSAVVCFDSGAIVDCVIGALPLDDRALGTLERTRRQVESAALELLTWREGTFQFTPAAMGGVQGSVRISTAMLLVEGARRIEEWKRLADRIPHARMIPEFVTAEPQQLPLLHLEPRQWEVLTRVDGQRDLPSLADALGRDLLEVAEIVHGLAQTGLLALVDTARPMRALPTPPSGTATTVSGPTAIIAQHADDLWVPVHTTETPHETPMAEDGYDAIFDPVRVGVITPEGLPRLRTPMHVTAIRANGATDEELRRAGDDACKRGDFPEALSKWSAYLKANENGPDAEHVREAIAITARLHALLHRRIDSVNAVAGA